LLAVTSMLGFRLITAVNGVGGGMSDPLNSFAVGSSVGGCGNQACGGSAIGDDKNDEHPGAPMTPGREILRESQACDLVFTSPK